MAMGQYEGVYALPPLCPLLFLPPYLHNLMRVRVISTEDAIPILYSFTHKELKKKLKTNFIKVFTTFDNIITNITEKENKILKTNPISKKTIYLYKLKCE